MLEKIKQYFPKNKGQWKMFLHLALPVIGGSLLFAMNSFVDNFMVGSIDGATAGLFAANSWTSIIMGIFAGSAATGSILVAQYYYSGNHDKVREIAKIRWTITLTVATIFTIFAWIMPEEMIAVFLQKSKTGSQAYSEQLKQGINYIKWISIMWMLIAFTFNLGNMYRETGWGKVPFYAGILGLVANILLNYLTMHTDLFVPGGLDAKGAAFASIAARICVLTSLILYAIIKKLPVVFKPWTIFQVSKTIQKQFWTRGLIFLFTASSMIFITIRNKIYVAGYPEGSIEKTIGSAAFLGLTGSLFGVFSVVFNAINVVVSKFVGGELGKNNIELAKENSKRLHGFNTTLAILASIILFAFSFVIVKMTFLQNTAAKEIHGTPEWKTAVLRDELVLKWTKYSLWPLALFFPWWIWFVTAKSSAVSGGKVNLVSTVDVVTAGPLQIGWLAIVMLVIVPATHINFAVAYFLFFLSDIPRGIAFMVVYYKSNWAKNITHEKAQAEQYAALDDVQTEGVPKE
ncbi:MAG: MATE family efflux transporter [Mycoplasmatales bacterium]|nr:MATE family efflux transporter [Mycoplasmatales bacterium]